ncbi:MAG: hypothetical protein JG768_1415 [Fusobacteriales bacterium]|nr:hypothetical protein [Fusobacteriales bacterium]
MKEYVSILIFTGYLFFLSMLDKLLTNSTHICLNPYFYWISILSEFVEEFEELAKELCLNPYFYWISILSTIYYNQFSQNYVISLNPYFYWISILSSL